MPQIGRNVHFTKMHGAGNDYIYINAMTEVPEDLSTLAHLISDRHFGIGSDGLVVIMPSEIADFCMRMFNADGSEAEMCGNASRCIAKYVYDKGLTDKSIITLETLAGIKVLRLNLLAGKVTSVTVDMGEPTIGDLETEVVLADGKKFIMTQVGMGNPHAIIFTDDLSDGNVLGNGPKLEVADCFPNKSNIEFVDVLGPDTLRMRVWERGSGETLACGTGACATAVAAALKGLTGRKARLLLRGGELEVEWKENNNHVYLTGGAEFIADGTYYYPLQNEG